MSDTTRLDRQSDQDILQQIVSLEDDLRELRTRQSIPRILTTKTYITALPGTWDINGVTIAASGFQNYSIIWTSDGTQPYPFAYLSIAAYNGGTQLADYGYRTSTDGGYSTGQQPIRNDINRPGAQIYEWGLTVYGPASTSGTYYVKVQIIASTKGTLQVF